MEGGGFTAKAVDGAADNVQSRKKGAQMGGNTLQRKSAKGEPSVCEIDPAGSPPPTTHVKREGYVTGCLWPPKLGPSSL